MVCSLGVCPVDIAERNYQAERGYWMRAARIRKRDLDRDEPIREEMP